MNTDSDSEENTVLAESAIVQASQVYELARKKLSEISDEVFGEICVNYIAHIETDAWMNYREKLRQSIRGWAIPETLDAESYFGREVRNTIFREHRDELEKGIIADQGRRIRQLEVQYKELLERRY